MSEYQKKSSHGISTAITIVVIIFAIGFWYFALYGPLPDDQYNPATSSGKFELIQTDYENITKISLDIQADVGDFDVGLLNNDSENLIGADWALEYRVGDSAVEDLEITFSNTTVNETIIITLVVDYPDEEIILIDDWDFTIYINPNYELYSIIGDIKAGELDVDLANIEMETFIIESSAGSIDINLNTVNISSGAYFQTDAGEITVSLNEVSIDGDLSVTTDAGAIDLNIENIKFQNESTIILDSDAGAIRVNWDQTIALGADIVLDASTDVGEIDIEIQSNLLKYLVGLETDIGDTQFNHEDWGTTNGYYQSPGFESSVLDLLQIDAETNVGSVEIDITL
ncbi:hypothetical protein [Candidatus Lokiarchaeum ossiferum]|uniref:hypothetical protein n=1 Tax=Candidatus Lokiarchaeum ossiferum TaxID=2951803 RepID=UPI00352C8C75